MPTTFDPGDPVVLTPLGAWAESVASSVFGSELSVASSSPVHLPPPLALTAPPLRDQVALPAPAISQDAWVATPSRPDSPNPPLPPDLRSDQKIGPSGEGVDHDEPGPFPGPGQDVAQAADEETTEAPRPAPPAPQRRGPHATLAQFIDGVLAGRERGGQEGGPAAPDVDPARLAAAVRRSHGVGLAQWLGAAGDARLRDPAVTPVRLGRFLDEVLGPSVDDDEPSDRDPIEPAVAAGSIHG